MEDIIISIAALTIVGAASYWIGHRNGVEDGINMAQDIATEHDQYNARTTIETTSKIIKSIDELVVLQKELRQAIILKVYNILDEQYNTEK